MERGEVEDWKGLLLLWFEGTIEEDDLNDEFRSPWFTVTKNGFGLSVGYEKGRDWLDLVASSPIIGRRRLLHRGKSKEWARIYNNYVQQHGK